MRVVFTFVSSLLVVALGLAGCGNKCDELADTYRACGADAQGGSTGGDDGEAVTDECLDAEEKCATCYLDSGQDLCVQEGIANAQIDCAQECKDVTPE